MRLRTACLALSLPLALLASPSIAFAAPYRTCSSEYVPLTEQQVSELPDADLALAAFSIVDRNGDGLVCYREYPNAPHHGGHYGNFIDNNAAPHQ